MRIVCKNCSLEVNVKDKDRKFCSQSCSASFNNKGVRRHGIPTRECKHCGDEFVKTKTRAKHCRKCIEINVFNKVSSFEVAGSDRSRKRILLEECGNKCFICKNSKWNGQDIPLELDHIDGNHENSTRDNLRILCPNCHAQTPTYKNRNKGNGRESRRERYKKLNAP